jgi:hypothetical protein
LLITNYVYQAANLIFGMSVFPFPKRQDSGKQRVLQLKIATSVKHFLVRRSVEKSAVVRRKSAATEFAPLWVLSVAPMGSSVLLVKFAPTVVEDAYPTVQPAAGIILIAHQVKRVVVGNAFLMVQVAAQTRSTVMQVKSAPIVKLEVAFQKKHLAVEIPLSAIQMKRVVMEDASVLARNVATMGNIASKVKNVHHADLMVVSERMKNVAQIALCAPLIKPAVVELAWL